MKEQCTAPHEIKIGPAAYINAKEIKTIDIATKAQSEGHLSIIDCNTMFQVIKFW